MKLKIDKILEYALVAILSIMVLDVLWQVFSRYVLNDPSSFTDELARMLMIWLGILGAAYASGQKLHLAIDLFSHKLTDAGQRRLALFQHTLIALFAVIALGVGGARLVYITYVLGQNTPALGIPMAYVYCVLPISGAIIFYYKLSAIKSLL